MHSKHPGLSGAVSESATDGEGSSIIHLDGGYAVYWFNMINRVEAGTWFPEVSAMPGGPSASAFEGFVVVVNPTSVLAVGAEILFDSSAGQQIERAAQKQNPLQSFTS